MSLFKNLVSHFVTGHSQAYKELEDMNANCIHHGRDYTVKILADASTNGMTEKEIRHMLDELERLRDDV